MLLVVEVGTTDAQGIVVVVEVGTIGAMGILSAISATSTCQIAAWKAPGSIPGPKRLCGLVSGVKNRVFRCPKPTGSFHFDKVSNILLSLLSDHC